MSDCCSTKINTTKKMACPDCNALSVSVSITTMQQHLINPWEQPLNSNRYYFCKSPNCSAVYFDELSNVFNTDSIRQELGIKSTSKDALICYCFGVSKKFADDPSIKNYVMSKTKAKECDCINRNPSGRCCLKDFPK